MEIDVIISSKDVKKEKIKGKVVVVIDTLRATSVMVTAISNGCSKIIPVKEIENAKYITKAFKKEQCLLCGERDAVKVDGFDLSNSPLEYTEECVSGKTIVMTTTNGTQAIKNCCGAEKIIIGAMINGQAVADKLLEINMDAVIVNAGTYGEFSKDDFITAGYIISRMEKATVKLKGQLELTDIAMTSRDIYNAHKDVLSYMEEADHYKRLQRLGLEDDLCYCLSRDLVNIVPEYRKGYIK